MYCLAAAARTLPIGTAYAVWTGIGAAGGTAILGMALLGEPRTAWRLGQPRADPAWRGRPQIRPLMAIRARLEALDRR